MRAYYKAILLAVLLAGLALCFAISQIYLTPISWDEGWNFCVAKNLVQHSHFGCSILGQLTTPRLANSWLPIVTAAAGFKLFGLDYVAGRVFITLLTLLAVFVLARVARGFSGARAAIATVIILLLLSAEARLHPLIIGSQVWGEMPMVLCVGLGFLLLAAAVKLDGVKALGAVLAASVFFGVALQTKVQLQPFWFLAMGGTTVFLVLRSAKREAALFLMVLLGSYWCWHHAYPPLPSVMVATDLGAGTIDAKATLGWVTAFDVRKLNFMFALEQGWFLILALLYLGFRFVADGFKFKSLKDQRLNGVFLALFLLVCGWLAWFILLAVDFARYLAPPLILGAPLIAYVLSELSGDFDFKGCALRLKALLLGPPRVLKKLLVAGGLGLGLLHVVLVAGGLSKGIVYAAQHQSNSDMIAMAEYINSQTPVDSVIETYETMLFFMLQRPFHYPADQVSIESIKYRYAASGARSSAVYNPLSANPAYVLVGPWGKDVFHIYDELVKSDEVIIDKVIGGFTLYRVEKPVDLLD